MFFFAKKKKSNSTCVSGEKVKVRARRRNQVYESKKFVGDLVVFVHEASGFGWFFVQLGHFVGH